MEIHVRNEEPKTAGLRTMELNDQKAGMEGLDKEHINRIIFEASKGTSYFIHQQKRQEKINVKIQEMLRSLQKISHNDEMAAQAKLDLLAASLESKRDLSHTIVHIDMDAFYAAVETKNNPELQNKPMAVGGLGMLSTSNYIARKFGVRAAMPGFIGKKLCPDLVIVPPHFKEYTRISEQIQEILADYDPRFLPASLDEAYLDITEYLEANKAELLTKLFGGSCNCGFSGLDALHRCCSNDRVAKLQKLSEVSAVELTMNEDELDCLSETVVHEIRHKIYELTGLTASAGIAPNMMLAKVCSDKQKPNGQYRIPARIEEIKQFVSPLPIRKVSGIGPVQEQLLSALGIHTCQELWQKRGILDLLFTPLSTEFYLRVALGLGCTDVKRSSSRKSKGLEVTFQDTSNPEELHQRCSELCRELAEEMQDEGISGRVVVLKIKTVMFETRTRSHTLPWPTSDYGAIVKAATQLLTAEMNVVHPQLLSLRLMGVRMTGLVEKANNQAIRNLTYYFPEKHTILDSTSQTTEEFKTLTYELREHPDVLISTNPELDVQLNDIIEDEWLLGCHSGEENEMKNTASMSPEAVERLQETIKDSECVHCPVCGKQQKTTDLEKLNQHIDECLSRLTIKEVLASQRCEKRKITSPLTEKKNKRSKERLITSKTMEDFFTLKPVDKVGMKS